MDLSPPMRIFLSILVTATPGPVLSSWKVPKHSSVERKKGMNEWKSASFNLYYNVYHIAIKNEFFWPKSILCFGKLSICQRESEDIKNGGTFWFFFYNLMLRGYPKDMFYSMFQGSMGKV